MLFFLSLRTDNQNQHAMDFNPNQLIHFDMKPHFRKYILLLLLFFAFVNNMDAQICRDISVHLNEQGTYTLNPYQVVDPDLSPEYEPRIGQSYFTCDYLGVNSVDVYILFEGDTLFTCVAKVTVLDFAPPTALCKSDLHVVLDSNGKHTFTFEELDNGSHNVCDNFLYKIDPPIVKCGDRIPLEVQLVLQDYSGYLDTCIILVTTEEDSTPTVPIVCPDMDTISVYAGPLYENHPFPVTSDMILVGGPYGCPQNYFVQLSQGGNTRPGAILTNADTNQLFLATITDLKTGDKCSTDLLVLGVPGCEVTFNICDTYCHGAPTGECGSGHTYQDDIEWPCNIVLSDQCPINYIVPSPELLEWYPPEIAVNAFPKFSKPECESTVFFGAYDIGLDTTPSTRRILRDWTVLNWFTQEVWNYQQIIEIHFDLTEICDTQPWDAPMGDCASGHTLFDDVEWPADITISSNFTHPDDLELNPEVDSQNVRPQLNTNCNVASLEFHDILTEINDSTFLVARTWTVIDSYSAEEWDYTQYIQARKDPDGSTVCITHEQGQPIPATILIPGIETDASGCYTFENPDGVIVTPTKSSPQNEGVNVLDMILMKEYLLGHITLSLYERLAGDINNSFGMSALDMVMMAKLIQGILESPLSKVWRFLEQVTHFSSIDISDPNQTYKFIGVKTGDIDNSYVLGAQDHEDIFLKVEDEILNKGETYQIPIYLSEDINLKGFSFRISSPNQHIEFVKVTAPSLPDFGYNNDVHLETNQASILYVTTGMFLEQGLPINFFEPIIILEIKANENVILNEELVLATTFDNLLKPGGDDPPLDLHFEWEDVIIDHVASLGPGRDLKIYPNPVRDQLYIKGLDIDDYGIVRILDGLGRQLLTTPLQPIIDVSTLAEGLYYLTITLEDGTSTVMLLYKSM